MKYLRAFYFNEEFIKKEFDWIEFAPITVFCGSSDAERYDIMEFIVQNIFNKYIDYDYYSFCDAIDEDWYGDDEEDTLNDSFFEWDNFNCNIEYSLGDELDHLHTGDLHAIFETDDAGRDMLPSEMLVLRANDIISEKYMDREEIPLSEWARSHHHDFDKYDICFLDSPETCLSIDEQTLLVRYIEECAYKHKVQFIIATASPVIAKISDAVIYDVDSDYVTKKEWNEVGLVKKYRQLFCD